MGEARDEGRGRRATARGLAPGDDVGGHTIERLLGRGGMGTVYAARNAAGMLRAVKVPSFEGDDARGWDLHHFAELLSTCGRPAEAVRPRTKARRLLGR